MTYYEFPAKRDPELQTVYIEHSMMPDFVTFNETHYLIEPIGIQGLFQV